MALEPSRNIPAARTAPAVNLAAPANYNAVAGLLFGPEAETRRKALRALIERPSALYAEVLVWKLADEDRETAELAVQALRALGAEALPVLREGLYGTLIPIRLKCTQLLGDLGGLGDLVALVVALFDYDVDIREAARRAFRTICKRHTAAWEEGRELPDASLIAGVIQRLLRVLAVMDATSEVSLVQAIVSFGRHGAPCIWTAYPNLEEKVRAALDTELLRRVDDASFEVLFLGLLDADPTVQKRAAMILKRLTSRATVKTEMRVLGQLDEKVRPPLAAILHETRILDTFCDFVLWLDDSQRQLLAGLVCSVDTTHYEDFLLQALRFNDPANTRRILKVFLDHPEKDHREALLLALGSPDDQVVLEAIEYFIRVGGTSSVNYLIPLLSDERPSVAKAAAAAISEIIRGRLIENFDSLEERSRAYLLQVLHKLDSTFIDQLRNSLDQMSEEEKIRFVQILSAIGTITDVRDDLKLLLLDPSPRVRATLARSFHVLTEVHERRVYCERLLRDEDARVRANAIEAVTDDIAPELLAELRRATRSDDNRERANALKRLLELGYSGYDIELVNLLDHEDPWFCASSLWVIGQLQLRRLSRRVLALAASPHPQIRQHAALALARMGSEEEVRALTPLLNDAEMLVRRAAKIAFRDRLGLDYFAEEDGI